MSKQATIQVRVDESIKNEAEKLLGAMGISLSEAVRIFMAQTIAERRLPFTPHLGRSEGHTEAFGKLSHYANPILTGEARSAWLQKQSSQPLKPPRLSSVDENKQPVILDETVLLHYLLNDDSRAANKSWRLIAGGHALVFPETITVLVQSLEADYHVPRSLLGTVIELLAGDVFFEDDATIRLAAHLFKGNRLPFRECLLSARNILTGYPLETFNKALSRAR